MDDLSKARGFEPVKLEHQKYGKEIVIHGQRQIFYPSLTLPKRGDAGSAGYDFYMPIDGRIEPKQELLVWMNVKAYMQDGEVLKIYPRSSVATKLHVTIKNVVGIIDKSYYSNDMNDGNIGIMLINNSGKTVEFKAGERIAQGIFQPFLVADEDEVLQDTREGGFGSTGE